MFPEFLTVSNNSGRAMSYGNCWRKHFIYVLFLLSLTTASDIPTRRRFFLIMYIFIQQIGFKLYQKYHIQIFVLKFAYLWTVSASWRSWKLRSSSRIKFIAISSSSWMECDLFFLIESGFVEDPIFLGPDSNYESNIIKWLNQHLLILYYQMCGVMKCKNSITHHSFLLKMVHLHRYCQVDSYLSYLHKYPFPH